jgi:eukaryotic-like serine/threonine-protein kinase
MQVDRWKKIEELFQAAMAQPAEKRLEFLDRACGDDPWLRKEVQSLLDVTPAAGSFLEGSPVSSMVEPPPALIRGQKLGNFEIVEAIGRGGMGEVYRARDSKLGRDVALKVLPEAFAGDQDRMARFHREARVLASLNHPHISNIHVLEETGEVGALVMELVEGPTLAERIAAGPLLLVEALSLARQIAEALEYAHEKGIVHRDLKPANVKVTPDGQVKVLDFGLAKLGVARTENATDSGTTGLVIGTAGYMSPEQAQGHPIDKRTDIWAFGVVLLEMLSGERTFRRETVRETLAAVLTRDPDWERLPRGTPLVIRKLLKRCLERDRRKRLRDIGEARITIEEYLSDPANSVLQDEAAARLPARRQIIPWAIATLVFAAVALILALLHFRETRPETCLL